jgi:hypothetical protein
MTAPSSYSARARARVVLLCVLAVGIGVSVLLCVSRDARAAGPTKEECISSHSKGQDAREAGQMSLARRLFLTCAQPSCPALITDDCARFSDELDRLQPTATFTARDPNGADLPDTAVYVDGVLTATHLSDGKVHDVDPGAHAVRFLNGSRETTMTVVFNQGEKGRVVVATFKSATSAAQASPRAASAPSASHSVAPLSVDGQHVGSRSIGPLFVAGAGVAMMVAGGVMGLVGLNNVPSACSVSTHQCTAPPNDPAFDTAKNGVTLADVGLGVGIAGAAAAVGGLIWYFASSPSKVESGGTVQPWLSAHGGGLSFGGSL